VDRVNDERHTCLIADFHGLYEDVSIALKNGKGELQYVVECSGRVVAS
jgi:hypothetical protein